MFNPITALISEWSKASGLDPASLSMAICLFISFPFNAVLKRLPDENIVLKNVYIISVSAFYLFGILSLFSGFRTLFISSMFTFLCTRYLKSNLMPYINFAFVMGHLASNHIYYQFFNDYDATKVDITGAQMVLTMKLTAFAWCVYDGRRPDSELSQYQRQRAIKHTPDFLSFLSYCFFYPSLMTGPSFEYVDYEKWLNSELFIGLPESKRPGRGTKKRRIPKSGRVAFYRVLQAIGWLLLWQKSGEYISMDLLFDPSFKRRNFFIKVFLLYATAFTYRLKYYAAWTISEASCILAGLGYNGYDKETKTILWDRVQNVDIFAFETSQNIHGGLEAWNQNTNKWLKNYVYLRVAKKGKKPGFKSTLATFLISAFWHGTRPGYYLSFALGALLQTCGRIYRRNLRPIFLESDGITPKPSKFYYDIVCWIVTQATFGYLVQPFAILDFKKSLYVWSTVYYFINVGVLLTFIIFQGPFKKQVIELCKKYQPQAATSAKDAKLSEILKAKKEFESSEHINLGIPNPDFENTKLEDIKKELDEFKEDVKNWKEHEGPTTEQRALKDAFQEFSKDLNTLRRT